jgi:hypothetical protein
MRLKLMMLVRCGQLVAGSQSELPLACMNATGTLENQGCGDVSPQVS